MFLKSRAVLYITRLALLMFSVPLLAFLNSPVMAQESIDSPIRLLASDDRGATLAFRADSYEIIEHERGERQLHTLSIPGMVQSDNPGQPQLPTLGTLIGVPPGAAVTLEVIDSEYEVLENIDLLPAPQIKPASDIENLLSEFPGDVTEEYFVIDPEIYAKDALFPTHIVELGQVSLMRNQHVLNIQFTPVQFNPVSKEARLYSEIVVRVQWAGSVRSADFEPRYAGGAYENLLRESLLNYAALERPSYSAPSSASESAAVSAANLNTEPVTNTLKLGVSEDGLYMVSYADMTAAGISAGTIDPDRFQLHNQGNEIPILVAGAADATFDPEDTILFYGRAITDVYTLENFYWLSWDNPEPGQRMVIKDGSVSGTATTPTHFPIFQHLEEDTRYWQTMPNGEGQDHWFWEWYLEPEASREITLTLNNLSTEAISTTMRIRLKGRTDTVENPDHHTRIYLNEQLVSDSFWDGQIEFDHVFTVAQSMLNEGENILRLENVGDTGAETDQILHNWIEIEYWDTYVAEENQLYFGAPSSGAFLYDISNFTANDIYLFDITDPHQASFISNTQVISNSGSYNIQFEDDSMTDTRYLALTPDNFKSPASITLDEASEWRSSANGADYIIITHSDFYTDALRLADHRRSTGLRVETVKIEDVYDEFNGGVFNPEAIQRFLAYAYENWTSPAPTYVLLFGDAAQDYRNILGFAENNFVPAQIFQTSVLGETPTDNYYVAISGDDPLPDMFIGRLSVQSGAEAKIFVDKIIQYENEGPSAEWDKRSLLIADDEFRFESLSERIAETLPDYYDIERIFKATADPEDPVSTLVDAFNMGNVLVNYSGHGNIDIWGAYGQARLMEPEIIETLNNEGRLPVLTVANCLNGFFVGSSSRTALAESMTRLDNKGAIAVWAPTDLNYPSGHQQITADFYNLIFQDDIYALGQATSLAKVSTYAASEVWSELIQAYVLFGDPALQIGIPPNVPYVESISPAALDERIPLDQQIQVMFNKPMVTNTVQISVTGGAQLSVNAVWTDTNRLLTLSGGSLAPDTTYEFTVSGQDKIGNQLSSVISPTTWSMTTMADGQPPTASSDGSNGDPASLPADAPLTVSFDEPVRIDSVRYTVVPDVAVEATWDEASLPYGRRLTLSPVDPLVAMQAYTVTIDQAVDVAGNSIAEPLQVVFTTASDNQLVFLPITSQ